MDTRSRVFIVGSSPFPLRRLKESGRAWARFTHGLDVINMYTRRCESLGSQRYVASITGARGYRLRHVFDVITYGLSSTKSSRILEKPLLAYWESQISFEASSK